MISPIKVQAIVHEMPAMQGEIFRCDQGYNECDPSHCSFYSYGKAWDFNLSSTTGNDDLGFPIVASAAGRVTYAQNYRPAENDEWGNCVVILYDNEPQGYSGLYAHLNEIFIEVGEHVERGQVIGTIGDGDENYLSHLHYQLQDGDNPDAPSASGLFSDIGLPTSPNTYTSLNDNIFVLEENVRNLEGNRNGNIIWWPGEWNTDDRYDNSYAKRCYLQNYRICEDNDDEKPIINQPQASSLQDPDNKKNQRTSSFSATSSIPTDPCTNHAIVYDALGGARKAYTLKSAIWSIWAGQDGSQGPLGMPITNQYYYGGTVRQDFQKGYIEGGVVYSPEAGFMPGEDDNSWNNQYSYLFALAYERNGGRTKVGYATSDVYVYGDDGYLRQDFNWGEYGECCIIYDPQNAVGNDLATNEAYLLRTGFYDLYNTIEVGGSAGGCPTRDEYMSRDPQNWEDPTEYPLQNFFSRRDYLNNEVAQHYMIWKDDSASYHSAYTVSYISQTPSGQVNLFAGQTYQFEVQYRNTGTNSWYNTAEGHLNAYVELKSCDANGLKTNSFLNWPYDASLGWLNSESPCSMVESQVRPGEIGTFIFTSKVPADATTGLHEVYFRLNHSLAGLMEDWGGMHFQVNVGGIIEEPIYRTEYVSQIPSGQITLQPGQTSTFTVVFKNTGNKVWYNDPVAHPLDYVELKSSDGGTGLTASFLNWPYDASLGWLNYESPTTMNEASVEPGQNATFTFTGKAPTNAAPGTYQVYFRPNHSRSGLLQGWGGMHFVVVVEDPATYACAYVSQNPSGQFDMIKGSQGTFTVSFRNTGNRTWYNNPSVYPNDYVELKSCDAAQNKTASFLNWPYDASLGWLNYESPTTMNEASVEPGGIATFTFTGKVAASASSGMHTVYFSPHHSVAEMLPGWGGMHYQVNVLDPPVYSCEYVSQSPAGQFNFGEGTSRIVEVKFRNTGNRTWRKNASIYPNDYVELKSCASNGLKTNSFFNWPYVSGQGWLNSESPCTFVESSVPPGSIGTFRFTARVNEGQSAGLKLVYFRPHHSVNGGTLLDGWGGMHFQANIPVSYSCQYVSQSPAGQFNMAAGTQRAFWVKFKNTGNTTWRNNPSSYPNDYVELKSSDGGSGLTASFLNWPYDASLGWLNYESPTTMSESSIGPGGTATFSFTGKVNGGTSPGLRLAYFRPNHSVNGGTLLEDWGGMHYQVNVTASTAKLNDLGIPISFSLSQNYPNPFNPQTTISYTLPSATHVRLDVFNILGQNVQTLVNKHQTAGEHTVLWNSEKFSSGIYLYRIQTGEKTETKKMILLK